MFGVIETPSSRAVELAESYTTAWWWRQARGNRSSPMLNTNGCWQSPRPGPGAARCAPRTFPLVGFLVYGKCGHPLRSLVGKDRRRYGSPNECPQVRCPPLRTVGLGTDSWRR
jgi:hypothetical protein